MIYESVGETRNISSLTACSHAPVSDLNRPETFKSARDTTGMKRMEMKRGKKEGSSSSPR